MEYYKNEMELSLNGRKFSLGRSSFIFLKRKIFVNRRSLLVGLFLKGCDFGFILLFRMFFREFSLEIENEENIVNLRLYRVMYIYIF